MHILTFVFCFDEFEGIAAWSHRHVELLAELLPDMPLLIYMLCVTL